MVGMDPNYYQVETSPNSLKSTSHSISSCHLMGPTSTAFDRSITFLEFYYKYVSIIESLFIILYLSTIEIYILICLFKIYREVYIYITF